MTEPRAPTAAMAEGRRADTTRRRQRVLKALGDTAEAGEEITISGVARRAGVDRTFLYRHRDLLEHLHTLDAQPHSVSRSAPTVSRSSLKADLLAAHHRAGHLAARVQHLEQRLSELLGEQTWRESGLGAPDDIDQLQQHVAALEGQLIDTRVQLGERDDELVAARTANRELMTRLNVSRQS